MLLLGGLNRSGIAQTGIWMLKNENWSHIGELSITSCCGNAIYIDRAVYYFGAKAYKPGPIHRLDFSENEELRKVELIGNQRQFFSPVLFQAEYDFCV